MPSDGLPDHRHALAVLCKLLDPSVEESKDGVIAIDNLGNNEKLQGLG